MAVVSKSRCRDLIEQGNRLFSERRPLENLWQTMAMQFDPIRADFTAQLDPGAEFAAHLMSGRPLLSFRDLANSVASMLRPSGKQWVHARTTDERINKDAAAKQSLDAISERLLQIFTYQHSKFQRCTKQGDKDFVNFGQCVIEPRVSRDRKYIFFTTWHLRDTVWCEDNELKLKRVDRNWGLEAVEVEKLFPGKMSSKIDVAKEPYRKMSCRHIVIPADEYDLANYTGRKVNRSRFPYCSIVVDVENDTIMEEMPRRRLGYVIPRWVTPSGTQYAHSPATIVALPEARLLQQITLTLLEAGQKAVDPPLVATRQAIMGGVNYWPGGTTWIDAEYDERTGPALRPVADFGKLDLRAGEMRAEKIEQIIHQAFFLDKIALPTLDNKERTMYEVSKIFEDYVRGALPLFEPLEVEYSAALCEETFQTGVDHGAFADIFSEMPQALRGRDVVWRFESPLQAAVERAKSEQFVTSMNLLKIAAEADPDVKYDLDINKAHRDAQLAGGTPSDWIRKEEDAERLKEEERDMAADIATAQQLGGAAQVAGQVGDAAQRLQGAGLIPGAQQAQAA